MHDQKSDPQGGPLFSDLEEDNPEEKPENGRLSFSDQNRLCKLIAEHKDQFAALNRKEAAPYATKLLGRNVSVWQLDTVLPVVKENIPGFNFKGAAGTGRGASSREITGQSVIQIVKKICDHPSMAVPAEIFDKLFVEVDGKWLNRD